MDLIEDIRNCYARENDTVYLLCKDSVRTGTYHSANVSMTWEKCDLRNRAADVFLDGNVSYPGCPLLHSLLNYDQPDNEISR